MENARATDQGAWRVGLGCLSGVILIR